MRGDSVTVFSSNFYEEVCLLKIVYPICCGVDVHKKFLVGTIITTQPGSLEPHYQKRRFSTFNSDLNRFADWLYANNCLDVSAWNPPESIGFRCSTFWNSEVCVLS